MKNGRYEISLIDRSLLISEDSYRTFGTFMGLDPTPPHVQDSLRQNDSKCPNVTKTVLSYFRYHYTTKSVS